MFREEKGGQVKTVKMEEMELMVEKIRLLNK
jgi:hypothetical protein